MQINNLCDHPLAAEATGLDTRADGWEAGIAAAFADHPVLCLRRQWLDADGYGRRYNCTSNTAIPSATRSCGSPPTRWT